MEIDFRLSSIKASLAALEVHRNLLEKNLIILEKNEKEKLKSKLEAHPNLDTSDKNEFYQEMAWLTEYLYPKIFGGSFILTLWAVYETSIIEIAKFAGKKEKYKAKDEYKKSLEYLKQKFNTPSESTQNELNDLYTIRNAYAHANGKFSDGLDVDKLETLKRLIEDKKIEEGLGDIIVSSNYSSESFDLIKKTIEDLMSKSIHEQGDY